MWEELVWAPLHPKIPPIPYLRLMPLLISASGIRGTTQGQPHHNLTPLDAATWTAAWAAWLRETHGKPVPILVGQDARPSGTILRPIAIQILRAFGHEVWDAGLITTPTLALAIPALGVAGGLLLTASHNPAGWNALKLLNEHGEFLPPQALQTIQEHLKNLSFPATESPGPVQPAENLLSLHIQAILRQEILPLEAIRARRFRVVLDAINSGGALYIPPLLEALSVQVVKVLHGEPHGRFAHPPEPLPNHLTDLSRAVQETHADLGIAVDPDVDRVAFFLPDGNPFGEEYSLVVAADYILSQQKGPVVANLSTTQAVQQIAERYGVPFHASAVGEYHVVQKMKAVGAVIGGEGNGGVIWPAVHYGRDALVGITLMLARLTAFSNAHELRESYPSYYQVKISVPLSESPPDWKALWNHLKAISPTAQAIEIDGLKLRWPQKWVHIRPSGTEPILRIYAEAPTQKEAEGLAAQFKNYLS